MSATGATVATDINAHDAVARTFPDRLGHPAPLWMLFMAELCERFAFYGIRWAMVLYVVAQFYQGAATGEKPASELYGAYLALVYAGAIFGGYIADKLIGHQRSILLGAAIMAVGLFLLASPTQAMFKLGLATIIVGNGMFKPIISTLVGRLYTVGDPRRDAGFTIFYMGINVGALIAPPITQYLARKLFAIGDMPSYRIVFISAGVGMILSFIWFWFGRAQLKGIGESSPEQSPIGRLVMVALVSLAIGVPLFYVLLTIDAKWLQVLLMAAFVVPVVMLVLEGMREGKVARDMVVAMVIIFVFNVLFWMFFEQAGSSFNFLADRIINRDIGMHDLIETLSGERDFPVSWFQSVNSIAIIALAPVLAWIWVAMGRRNPIIPRKFALGLVFNGLAFLLLMFALSSLVDANGKIPFWTLFMVYVIQSVGELCLSPIGLSMTTKLAPMRLAGFAMGCWFLSVAIGNNLAGIFAGEVSGDNGMTVQSAYAGYTFGFYALVGAGVVLFLVGPLVQRLMHGVK